MHSLVRAFTDRRQRQRAAGRQRGTAVRILALVASLALVGAACGSDDSDAPTSGATAVDDTTTRPSGLTVTVQVTDAATIHTLTAPEEVFANSTHIFETANSLIIVDTQFLLPNALDVRAYADELDKPIDRVFITHSHPDHFLGSEAFADVDVYALPDVADEIAANGDAEVAEKQADFGDAIASTFVTPQPVEPGTVEIDGVAFELAEVLDAEAETQLVISVSDAGAVVTGDIVYSGVHLILAGQPEPWTTALTDLQADSDNYPIVLAGHGLPGTPEVYETNIAWLAKAGELMGTAADGAAFKAGLVDAFPELGMNQAIDFVLPFLFPEDTEAAVSEVAFGECAELATGTVVPLDTLQTQLPDGVTALSLTAQGTVFEGSDTLGVLITRTLECDDITVTAADGESVSDGTHIAHVGTPIDANTLPDSPYNNDGGNGADFNNYVFGYYSDSAAYVAAMENAGIDGAELATITMTDDTVEECVLDRSTSVDTGSFAFDATGVIPDPACEDPVVPFIANWWSLTSSGTGVLSNTIPGQAAIFIDTAETVITITPTGDAIQALLGPDPVVADAFGVIGLIPASDGSSMTITTAG